MSEKSIQEILDEQKHLSKIHRTTEARLNRTIANKLKGDSSEFKEKMSKVKTGKKRPDMLGDKNIAKTKEERLRRSELLKGKPKTQEHVEKIKQARLLLPTIRCPHCGMESKNQGNMNRYHFDNCDNK